eukprot:CAMPEP_0196999180 /NCGR_PEP_ID=MMETSP1380-20130617/4411_1 /TAXON_ID=5936 /ORGANISM="Euplotes crassus, Strain CT5" /LENGTH=160 /DNA_ID=CAMNT_0042416013 /DNA_START=239 /DNA_END=722 /DNA_ORIENTATION=+
MSLHKQISDLSQPGSLKKYLINEKYPPKNGGVYQYEVDNFEKWEKSKLQSKDPFESGFVTLDALKSNELPDSCFPGLVYEGSRYLGNTFTKFKEEKEYFQTATKNDYDECRNILDLLNLEASLAGREDTEEEPTKYQEVTFEVCQHEEKHMEVKALLTNI